MTNSQFCSLFRTSMVPQVQTGNEVHVFAVATWMFIVESSLTFKNVENLNK